MKITQETDYALRIVEYLSEKNGKVVESSKISEDLSIPKRFSLKILRKLNLSGITDAERGVNGGYYLVRKPEEITYLDVFEAIEGKLFVNKCLENPDFCNRGFGKTCNIHKNLYIVQEKLNKELKKYNFALKEKE